LDWLDATAVHNAAPFLRMAQDEEDEDEDMDDIYPPMRSIDDLREYYESMRDRKGSRRDIVSRITEGDWRHGLSLYQLAMADFAYLDEHPTSQNWSAYNILPLCQPSKDAGEDEILRVDKQSLKIPRFHPSTFLQNLQEQIMPDVKAHYHFHRPKDFAILMLRVFVVDSPYSSDMALSGLSGSGAEGLLSSSRTVYLAFPDGSPSLYITKTQSAGPAVYGEAKSLRQLIVDGVPKALSRPNERFTLRKTNLASRNLNALLDTKGPGRGNAAGGGWSIYADEKNRKSPLDSILPPRPLAKELTESHQRQKRKAPLTEPQRERKQARLIARGRFGNSALVSDGKGVEKLEVVLRDPFPAAGRVNVSDGEEEEDELATAAQRRRSKVNAVLREVNETNDDDDMGQKDSSTWTPTVKIQFNGAHVFAGIRQLVAAGIVDGVRMPGWMTGEEGVTTGVIKDGRISGHKGSGI
jgi:central kinetochore subunit Mis15/CHL4